MAATSTAPSISSALSKIKLARDTAVPLAAVETADPAAFLRSLSELCNGATPLCRWDAVRGLTGVNDPGTDAVRTVTEAFGVKPGPSGDVFVQPQDALKAISKLPSRSIAYFTGLDRLLGSSDARFASMLIQAIANLRDPFKISSRMLIIAGPSWQAPAELSGDVLLVRDPLPTEKELGEVVDGIASSAQIELEPSERKRATDALIGLPAFGAEQAAALSVHPADPSDEESPLVLDQTLILERKEETINACPGLSVYKGDETFDSLYGLDNVKAYFRRLIASGVFSVFVFVDELEKSAPNRSSAGGDTSGASQEIERWFLTEMQDNEHTGSIFLGRPGGAKSALAKALANESGLPVIALDVNGCKASLLGETGRNLRRVSATLKAIAGGPGRVCWVATSNNIDGIKPELLRRFKEPTFYFSGPTAEEQEGIVSLYEKKWAIDLSGLPRGESWTGAEIRSVAEKVKRYGFTAEEASGYVVPIAVSARESIDALEASADGRYTSASYPGKFRRNREEVIAESAGKRKFSRSK